MAFQKHKIIFSFIASCCLFQHAVTAEHREKRQSSPPQQPRIVTTDGHLVFQTGANHNITFKSSTGGAVNIDGTDVKQMSLKVDLHQAKLEALDGIEDRVGANANGLNILRTNVDNQFTLVTARITNTTRIISRVNRTVNRNGLRFSRLRNKVRRIQTSVNQMNTKLRFDNCASGPCHNGGTCIDMYDSFRCFCPVNWQGTTCNEDVNECQIYAGTAQGCHTGSSCLNTNGGFSCLCSDGFTGVLCNVRSGGCDHGSNSEICGSGTCIDSGSGSHTCVCDDGWTGDTATPARCTVDINECEQVAKPCHDSVQCINVPGAYFCGPCPTGFTGNGHQCSDINECLVLNGGCSINPAVECTNTIGSRICGACPAGYEKTPAEACIWVGLCHDNNGGCNPNAQCRDNPSLPTRSCQCNPGYTGSGEGSSGCLPVPGSTPSPDVCAPNPCQHGNCFSQPNTNAFTCSCFTGWTGHLCQNDVNECSTNICQNGGNCTNTPGNYTCACTPFATGRNCETTTYECGGERTGETGSFRFPPLIHDAYPHSVSCAWRITTTLNKILSITFTMFSLERHSNCDYDFLQIHDGRTASAHKIGKYCGNDTELGLRGKTINSTHNMIYMWFKTDQSVSDQGFAFNWRSYTPECGGDIRNTTSGTIASPGFPGPYPNSRTCVWTIRVPPGNNIKLTFTTLDLEHHSNCSYDYLEVRNGLLATDAILNRHCSDVTPESYDSDGNELYIKFHSDQSANGNGFQFTYAAIPSAPHCGGSLNLTDGILISPNYPNHYDHNGDCVWVITVPVNGRIALNFTAFQMESSSTCAYDYLEIIDGSDDTGALFGKFCGNQLPGTITSNTNNLYLRFHSDSSVSGSGFRATWTVACGGTFTAPTGEIISPFWPANYPHRKTCNYLLSAREDQAIEVTFTNFQIEASELNGNCVYDSLTAFDGTTSASTQLRRMCGTSLPVPLISTGPNMFLIFSSDGSVTDLGFRATYEFRNTTIGPDPSTCGGILTNASGTIVSPGHPNVYPHGVECLWEIRVTPGFQIRLSFDFFSIESSSTCAYDFVQISNNESVSTTTKYCGSTQPPTFTSIDNVLYMRFRADQSIAHEGFSASYVSFNHSWCGDERRTLPGVILSPNYPANYPHQRECIWTIVAPDNHQVALNFTDFLLEEHIDCRYDYLEVRNGGSELSPLVGRYCGSTVQDNPLISQSNRLWIKFKSDVSDSARGFRIWYEDAGEGCGADLTGPSGMFQSPNYPITYNRNAECYWTITVSQGSSIVLLMVDFDVETHSTCQYDYVEAIEGLHRGPSIAKVCGTTPPQPIQSRGNVMTVKFRSDSSLGGRGFHAAYYSDCQNQNLTDWRGVIESPNFPQLYPHQRNCTWTISTTIGNILTVAFSHFDIEDHSDCVYDFLEIRDGNTPSANLLHPRYCGQELPAPINSTASSLYIRFRSDASLAHNGFRLEYTTIGCGGDLTASTGAFASPNFPGSYPHNRECVWRITVPIGNRIKLNLVNVDIEYHSNCSYDYIQVLGGSDSNAPQLTKICQNRNQSSIVTSSGNEMYILFKTDQSSSGTGFNASYESIDGGCGGVYTTPTGSIHSPGHPGTYPTNTECDWNITVAEFQTVQITFKVFDLEDHNECIYDYVAMYDGLETDAPLIRKICGSNLTDHTFTSTGRSMRIRMRTDLSTNAQGFLASYTTACGGRTVVGDGIGLIRSPNFPANYNPNTNCTWTLLGTLAVDRITLQFTHMDIEESDESFGLCAHDSIRVLQGDNADAPQQGIYCGNSIPTSITSTGYALTVIFTADASIQSTGFSASYSKSTSFCGGNLTATSGAFSTPNYPTAYPRNAECIWYLNASPGNQIQLSFGSFSLEDTEGCARDFVEVRDGSNLNNILGRYCGSTIPSNLTVAKSMYIRFRSDNATNFNGFTAQFSTLTGGDLVGNTGQLASPLYPRPYPHNSESQWTIIVDIGKKVRIEFSDMDIETGADCNYDYLQFLDGPIASAPTELLKTCGTTTPAPFSSTSNVMTVVFHTDVSATGRGFLLSWTAVDQVVTTPGPTVSTTPAAGCNFNLVAGEDPQNISTPGYPTNYENNMNCLWTIRSANGARIKLNIQRMDIENSFNCVYDALRIFDGDVELTTRSLGVKCGRVLSPAPPIVSSRSSMLLRFTTDSSVTRSGFFGTFQTTCGGILTDTAGEILSPNHPNVYPTNSSCQWLITVAAGRTIELTVESFNLPSSANCTGDRLRILNGNNAESPQMEGDKWAYCGGQSPSANQVFTSGSRYMFVDFSSNGQSDSGNPHFKLTYIEKSVVCGGDLTIPDDDGFVGSFTSPNFGQDSYPENADCTWVITAPANARVQLDFPHFDLEKHADCHYDYVLIRDGGTENSQELTRLCGGDTQATVRSSSNVLRVRLITDSSVNRGGFNITFQKATCGGTLIGASGTILSPQFPNEYPSSATCEWYIEAPTGHYITMNFTVFTLGNTSPSDCTGEDTLELHNRDRFGNVTTQVGSYCGRIAPVGVRTADSRAYLKFTSNSNNNYRGFSLTFTASVDSCGGQLTNPTGVISSPNYPGYYPHSRECRWFITAPLGKRITLNFDDFEIETQSRCLFDYLEVINGHLERSPTLGRYCGNNTAHVVESTGSKLLLVFNSDGSISNGGFRISYSTAEPIVCGGVINPEVGEVGTIHSPGYIETVLPNGNINLTGQYPNNMQCEWVIEGSAVANRSIVLKFSSDRFKLEHDGECRYDFLQVREGVISTGLNVGRFCSNFTDNVPPQIAIPGNQMWMAFVSDGSIQHEGFNISYQLAPCGGVLSQSSGVITSPNYPNNYNHDMGCAWLINVEEGQQIVLTINDFSLETSLKCDYDYVALHNGPSHTSPVMDKLCQGTANGTSYTSAGSSVRIEFASDFSESARGFSISYVTRSQGCGGMFHGLTGNFSSQNYPDNYPHNLECIWDIKLPDGYHVVLNTAADFDIESGTASDGGCFYDYVQFYDVNSDGEITELGPKLCGNQAPPTQQSNGNHMRIKFRSDRWTNARGFSMSWTAGCGGTYNSNTGTIFSPGYPINYQHNLTCDYIIVASPSQYVVLQFDEDNFRIEPGSSCQYDAVSVFEGSINGTSKGSFCGLTAPQPIATRGSMVVRFTTDGDTADDGFKADFLISDCGGYLNGTSGQLRSPTHPVDYHNNLNCTWLIEVSDNRAVSVRFEYFDVEASSNGNCQYDYLALYNGPSVNESALIGKFCGSVLPEDIRSISNLVTVVFKTDSSVTKGGFRAVYTETHGPAQGCGGNLNVTANGTIVPVRDSDGNYVNSVDCIWILTAPDSKVLSVQISNINIESGASACEYDGLDIYDGFSAEDPRIANTICGTVSTVRQYVSATNMMRIRFYADSSITGTGFSLAYSAVDPLCGGVSQIGLSDAPVTISSPSYPGVPSVIPANCRWTIGAPSGKQIRLTVTALSINGDENCAQNFLQLRDQPISTSHGPAQNLQFCNATTPYVFDSYGNEVQVNFKYIANAASGFTGFSLNYAVADCNRTVTGLDGRITSPGWPSTYPHNMNCVITIAIPGPTQYRISVFFSQFSIEDHSSCGYDYLEIYDGTISNSVGKHCGNSIPQPVMSTGNTMLFRVSSDSSLSLGGFDLTYIASQSGCGGTLTATRGVFSNPPTNVSTNCEWVINLPARRRATLTFDVMDLRQNNTACPTAYVEVRDGGDSLASVIGRFCDGATPPLTSTTNQLYIKYVATVSLHNEANFIAKYTSEDQAVVRRAPRLIISPAIRSGSGSGPGSG